MQTHRDRDAYRPWIKSLEDKAEKMQAAGESQITAGKPDEQILDQWKWNGVYVRQLPPDEHGILRISIGGGDTPSPLNYLVFRGDHGECVDLLRKALKALERTHES